MCADCCCRMCYWLVLSNPTPFASQPAHGMVYPQERTPDAQFTYGKTALHRACEAVRLPSSDVESAA